MHQTTIRLLQHVVRALFVSLALVTLARAEQVSQAPDANIQFQLPPLPPMSGQYRSSSEHPRVFQTPDALDTLARKIQRPGSFSAQRFNALAQEIRFSIGSKTSWTATYSGCDLDIYLHAFSYEPRIGYSSENRSDSQMRAAMNVSADHEVPAGAAVVAAKLALYASLIHHGASPPAGFPTEQQASQLASAILTAWASTGFKRGTGYVSSAEQFCDARNQFDPMQQNNVGLQIARGVVYSVQAQDLLQSLNALDAPKIALLNRFHKSMYELIRSASNFRASLPQFNRPDFACDLYSNHVGAHLLGLMAVARLLDDEAMFEDVLTDQKSSGTIKINWLDYFDHAIYGNSETTLACHENTGNDASTSRPYFQTNVTSKGEIEDRYRNATPTQAFSYSMLALGNLYSMATLMQEAGFDAFNYVGRHGKSIEAATQYHACFAKNVGFGQTVSPNNAKVCDNVKQYAGDTVTDVENLMLRGASEYPTNSAIGATEPAARARAADSAVDPISFGHWRD